MRRSRPSVLFATALFVLLNITFDVPALAQSPNIQAPGMAIGESPYAMYNNPADIDHVNPVTGNIFLSIPLLSYPQVGKDLRLQFNIYYNDKQWYIPNYGPSPANNGTFTGAWAWWDTTRISNQIDTIGPYVARDQHLSFGQDNVDSSQTVGQQPSICTYNWITLGFWVRGSDGSKHYYGDNSSESDSGNGCTGNPYGLAGSIYPASDESGYTPANGTYVSGSTQIRDASGVFYTSNGVTGETVTDPNGNSIVSTANGWTDSVGRTLPGSTALPGYADNAQGLAEDPVPGVPTAVGTECPAGTTAARDWAVPAEGGTPEHYYLCYSTFTYQTAFNVASYIPSDQIIELSSSSQNSHRAVLLSAVVLPNHTSYTFSYDQYLSLTELGLPTGGSISYTWQTVLLSGGNSAPVSRALQTRTINDNNGNTAKWTYHWQLNETTNASGGISVAPPFYSVVTDPLGNDTEYQFDGVAFTVNAEMRYNGCGPHDTFSDTGIGAKDCSPSTGTLMKTDSYALTQIVSYAADPNTPGSNQGPVYRPTTTTTTIPVAGGGNRVTQSVTSLSPPYGAPCTTYAGFGSHGALFTNQHTAPCSQYPQTASEATYGYGASGAGNLLRTDTTTYKWQATASYLTANLLNIPSKVVRTDAAGNPASETDYGYDESGSPSGARGNQTSVTRVLSGGNVVSRTVYNSQGMPIQTYDPKGHETTISYQCSGAFPENVVTPYGSTTTLVETTTYGYDCQTGLVTSKKDPNLKTTNYIHSDSMNRLTEVQYPGGGDIQLNYNGDPTPPLVTKTVATGETAGPVVTLTRYDLLGRPVQTQINAGPSEIYYVDTSYDLLGRLSSVSTPYKSTTDTTYGLTSYTYDPLGRKVKEAEADNVSSKQWCYGGISVGGATNCQADATGTNQYWVDYSDEVNRHWQQASDALGRLIAVMEPNGSTQAPTMRTDYVYDARDNLQSVTQNGDGTSGTRTRMFTYDGLSRLTQAFNPETGWTCYGTTGGIGANGGNCTSGYDADGNLTAKTDGRGFTTTYQYDDLGRMLYESSNAPNTLTHSWKYDLATVAGVATINPIGNLVFTGAYFPGPPTVNSSGTMYWNHDAMGRVLGTKVCTPATCSSTDAAASGWYDLSNTYDLAGNPTSYTDGFGTTISSTYDAGGRLLSVSSSKNDATHPGTLWRADSNGPVGLTQATLGNGVVNTLQYAKRMWLHSSTAKTATGPVIYSEALTYYMDGSPQTVTDPVNGNWTYTYDTLSRIATGVSTNTGQGCEFTYDSFGNRKTSTPFQGTCTSANLGFTTATNHVDGSCYDGAGNLEDIGPCPPAGTNHQFFYDGYNNLLSPNFNQTGRDGYVVDALRHRVGKYINGVLARMYLYGIDGNAVAEMDGSGNWLQTNVHVGAQFLAEYQGTDTDFQHSDHLGTIRAQSNSAGTRVTTCSNLPFGDSLNCNGNANPSGYHFTGKERDTESGNDYFGARYYSSAIGRFMSPDPSRLSIMPSNPQTWNRYAYVYNSPLSLNDDNGKWPTKIHNQIIDKAFPNLTPAQRQILKNVSAEQDSILLGGQGNDLAFQHAMRGPDQTVDQAQAQYNDFVSGEETGAQNAQLQFWMADPDNKLDNLSDASLEAFGQALHAILDSTSPAHAGFQEWNVWNFAADWRHHNAEKTISPQQMQNAVHAARIAYNATYGYLIGPMQDNSSVTTTQGAGTPCGGNTGTPCLK